MDNNSKITGAKGMESSPLFQKLNKAASEIITGKRKYEVVKVRVEPDPQMIEMLCLRLNTLLPQSCEVSLEDFTRYMRTLFKYRVDVVSQQRIPQLARHVLYVPALIGLILAQIGPVQDHSFGVDLQPICEIGNTRLIEVNGEKVEVPDLMTENEMLVISNTLAKVNDKGFRCIQGIPTHYNGELGFMSTALNNDVIESYRHGTAPGMALLSCVARNQMLNVTLSMATQYGMYHEYVGALKAVVFGGGNG